MVTTKENPDGTDCIAHLADGRIFKCPYKDPEDRLYRKFRCEEYSPKLSDNSFNDILVAISLLKNDGNIDIESDKALRIIRSLYENKVINIRPCEVGDTLYEVDVPEYGIITCCVTEVLAYNCHALHVPENEVVSGVSVSVEVIEGHGKGSCYSFELGDFNKSIFYTKEEALKRIDELKA
jgi:hypothetical protein